MKLELGKFEINDVQFAEKSYIENHVLYVNKAEVEALVLEDDKLIECRLDIARPGERTRITRKTSDYYIVRHTVAYLEYTRQQYGERKEGYSEKQRSLGKILFFL